MNDDIQVPESSSPSRYNIPSSSPLKKESDFKMDNANSLREKFSFKGGNSQNVVSPSKDGDDFRANLTILSEEFSDFSATLIQAVFKSNSFNLALSRERLNKIRSQRTSWSASSPKKVNRLSTTAEDSSKITLVKQKASIFDRYSNVLNKKHVNESELTDLLSENESSENSDPPVAKKKRRLVKYADMQSTKVQKTNTHLDQAKEKIMKKKSVKQLMEDEEEHDVIDDGLTDLDSENDNYEEQVTEENIDAQILKFINTAEANDIADLADIPIEKAKLIIESRTFKSIAQFSAMEFITEKEKEKLESQKENKRKSRKPKLPEGEKLVDKLFQSIKGYNAIDSLIKQCSSYGTLIASQIKKWGVDLEKPSENGELDITSLDTDDQNKAVVEEFDDSEVSGTPTPTPTPSSSTANLLAKKTARRIKRLDSEDEEEDFDIGVEEADDDEGADDDEDFAIDSKTRVTRTSNKIKARKLIKFFMGKPKLLAEDITLKDYQQAGINWLNLMYHNKMSCILADDMGLGKTCQVISFMAYLKQINEPGPHLVVVPSSTLENWLREFQKFCPELKIEPYYGTQAERADLRDILEENVGQYDVIVSTYNLAAGNKQDVSFLRNCNFNAIVYDEGHMLKNSSSERFNKLMRIDCNFRLLLTGTPLQNNLKELMSLLEFIMPSIFESKKESLASIFKQRAKTTTASKDYNPLLAQEAINRAKTMMRPFILRRRKDQVLKHLPAKHKHIVYCDMASSQREIYDKEIQMVKDHKKLIRDGMLPTDAKARKAIKDSSSKNLIMSLRKASIHPLLFRHIYDDATISKMSKAILREPEYAENGNIEYIKEDMSYMTDYELHRLCTNFPKSLSQYQLKNDEWMNSGKVEKLCELLKTIIIDKKEKVLIFSLFTQVLDILENVLSTLKYKFLRLDGSTQVNDRQSLIDKFYEDDTIPVFILSTKAGGFGINLVCANNVIIFDQSFNPHDDRQASDRAHRVGQTKEVQITTLITQKSIEEKILQLANNKLDLDSHISEDDKKSEDALESKVNDMLEDIIFEESTEEGK
ncbi:hypothetical protein TPHA_0H02660 [Tetrapisispora phaffii CBS 4417]|uniref:DNA helicase n=1 Tax=Tetrapisispora phaffii (strain ATCC 24235 / CBS 4417 / NBRC 1672 / NRRL Y-8282 / UCD 70-5) TaxID=1071381 RepID=G8BWL8_TETPH|nr:hypothetical protein TPHA_0H02660 [Tetrapisispora phaffii CBS 4417]CCE64469.1 hypothetical protein TPHA_0H02660 [Tetrapisispora phaffii CBS 4417]